MDFDQTRPDSIGGAIQAAINNDLKGLQGLSEKGHSMRICDNRGAHSHPHQASIMGYRYQYKVDRGLFHGIFLPPKF